jgi:hypothetical protein
VVADAVHRGVDAPPSALESLERLVAQAAGSGIDTSEGDLFNHTLWGRDRVITALDVLDRRPELARQSILALARLQGTVRRARSEEEPGRIHNEHRDLQSWRAPWWLKLAFRYGLAPLWGGTPRGYTEYFAGDSTPLYIQLVARYCAVDPGILGATVVRRDGTEATVRQSVLAAALWLVEHMSADGLIEIRKVNPLSLPSPTWKDSPTSNLDPHGRILNVLGPVAWLLVQTLAVDAFRDLADLLEASGGRKGEAGSGAGREAAVGGEDAALAASLRELAGAAQAALLREFWIEDIQYFGFAVDRTSAGERRVAGAVQSDAGWLLDSTLFDDLPEDERRRYVGAVVRRLFRADMVTPAGIRGRSIAFDARALLNYHETVWPMDTLKIARGLRRQGFHELAGLLEDRLLNAVNALGSHYEFIPVDAFGRIIDPRREPAAHDGHVRRPLAAEMEPDENLAWSVTGVLRLKRERGRRDPVRPAACEPWIAALTAEIMNDVSPVPLARNSAELAALRGRFAPLYLSHWRGLLRSSATILVQGFGRALPAGYAYRLAGGERGRGRDGRGF